VVVLRTVNHLGTNPVQLIVTWTDISDADVSYYIGYSFNLKCLREKTASVQHVLFLAVCTGIAIEHNESF